MLTQFLVYVISSRKDVSPSDILTTPMSIPPASSSSPLPVPHSSKLQDDVIKDIEIPSTPMIPVSDISRNMDVAFHAIFQDIKAFHAWKEEEKKLGLVGSEDIPQRHIPLRFILCPAALFSPPILFLPLSSSFFLFLSFFLSYLIISN